jgi:hypothetical protein
MLFGVWVVDVLAVMAAILLAAARGVAPFDLTVRTLAVRATRRVHENSIPSINSTLPDCLTGDCRVQ